MCSFRIASFLGLLSASAAWGCRETAHVDSKDMPPVEAVPLERLVTASVTVSYPVPDSQGATLLNYSGIALDKTRVLTVIVGDLPAEAKAPTIWFEDQAHPGTSWNFETVPEKEILLPEIGMKVLTSEKPLQGTAVLARTSAMPLGADVLVIGTYDGGLDGMVMRGNVAKLGGPPNDEDIFLVDATLSSSSAGAGAYDARHRLVGIVVEPFVAKELGIIYTRVGAAMKIEKIAAALRERGIAFSVESEP